MFDEIIKTFADALTVATTLRPPLPAASAHMSSRLTESENVGAPPLDRLGRLLVQGQIRSTDAGCIPAVVPPRFARWRIWQLPNRAVARVARQ